MKSEAPNHEQETTINTLKQKIDLLETDSVKPAYTPNDMTTPYQAILD